MTKIQQKWKKAPKYTRAINFQDDARPPEDKTSLRLVTRLAERILDLQEQLTILDKARAEIVEDLERVQMGDLPELMQSMHLEYFRLSSGETVTVKPFLKASLPTELQISKERDPDKKDELSERLRAGLAFLRKAGAGSLIKTAIIAQLGKDSETLAKSALRTLKNMGIPARSERGVHPSTLSAWVKERLANGSPVDLKAFAVFSGQKAEITTPTTNNHKPT